MNFFKKLFSRRKKIIILVVLLLISGLAGWRVLGKKNQQPQYQTTQVERGTIISSVSSSGQVLTANMVNVNTQASGVVKKVFVKDGDMVTTGQKIMEIDLVDTAGQQKYASAWSSYLSAKNSLESAKITQYTLQSDLFSKWDTFKKLAENSTYQNADGSPNEVNRTLPEFHIAENDWLAAEAKYKNQQAVINQAQAAFNNSWLSYQQSSPMVTAPMAGTILSLSVAEGMSLGGESSTSDTNSSQRVAVIQNQANPLATFNLSEIDIGQVKIGQKATITFDSLADKTFTGKVVSIDRLGTVTSGVTNYPLIIQFDIGSNQILPNMTATAEIIVQAKEDVLWVPAQAIKKQAGQTMVRTLVNGKLEEKPIEVGLETSSQAEIVSGLSEGETVVVSEITNSGETTFGGGGMRGIIQGGFRR